MNVIDERKTQKKKKKKRKKNKSDGSYSKRVRDK